MAIKEWKVVEGFDAYEVSLDGKVRRVRDQYGRKCDRALKLSLSSKGYLYAIADPGT